MLMMLESNSASFERTHIGATRQGSAHAWNSSQSYHWTGGSWFINNKKPEILMMLESNRVSFQRIGIGFTGQGNFHALNSGQSYRWTGGSCLSKVKGTDKTGIYLEGTQATTVSENGGTGKAT